MADKYLTVDTSTGFSKMVEATVTSSGAGNAGDIVSLDTNGRLNESVMPPGIGASTVSASASENLSAGDIVNLHDVTGTRSVRKANAVDATKPAHGFVLASVTSGNTATVYLDGQNTAVAAGSFTAADVGKTVFLATTAGGVTTTPPVTTGNLLQPLGEIFDVGAAVSIDFRVGSPTIM